LVERWHKRFKGRPNGWLVRERGISTAQRRLYLVLGNGQALSYAIAVGAAGYAWSGVNQVTDKRELAGLDAARGDAAASARSAASYGGQPGQSDGSPADRDPWLHDPEGDQLFCRRRSIRKQPFDCSSLRSEQVALTSFGPLPH
jgi:hypothetical protein